MAIQGAGNIPERIRVQPVQPQAPARKTPAPAPAAADQVTISPQAREAQSLARQVEAAPEVRPQAVASAKAQRPNPPAAKVAEKLLLES